MELEKPYKNIREITYEMITTHPYFKTLDEKSLESIIKYMDYDGYLQIKGDTITQKADHLQEIFENQLNTSIKFNIWN